MFKVRSPWIWLLHLLPLPRSMLIALCRQQKSRRGIVSLTTAIEARPLLWLPDCNVDHWMRSMVADKSFFWASSLALVTCFRSFCENEGMAPVGRWDSQTIECSMTIQESALDQRISRTKSNQKDCGMTQTQLWVLHFHFVLVEPNFTSALAVLE